MCGKQSTEEKEFKTDVDQVVDFEEMTCEACYDEINN